MRLKFKHISLVAATFALAMNASADIDPVLLTTKAPYPTPQQSNQDTDAPEGYRPVMIQHVARHGSRGLSSSDDEDLLYQLWQYAKERDELTPLGEQLGPQLEEMIRVHEALGFGQITELGRQEHIHQAKRLIERLGPLFEDTDRPILISHSGRLRAAQSGDAFIAGLLEAMPGLENQLTPAYASPTTLYFHSAEGSPDYLDYEENDPQLAAVLEGLYAQPDVQEAYRAVLLALFSPELVDTLERGDLEFVASADPEETLSSVEDAVEALYGLLTISSNLSSEGNFDFEPFFTQDQLEVIANLDDTDSFYGRGPGFAGRDVTYRAADALFAEMLSQANQTPLDTLASFRFTHSQVMMPVTTWLRMPNAWPGATAEAPFHFDTHGWRSALISPMAANLQWEIWEDDEGHRLVHMLYNEKPEAFPPPCEPLPQHPFFYRLDMINQCLMAIHPSLENHLD